MKKYFKDLLVHPLFAGSAIMIIGLNSTNFINYIYHFLMGKLLGPTNYGELVSLISLIGLLGVIPGSLSLVIIKYISSAKNNEEVDTLVAWLKDKSLKFAFIFFVAVIIVSPFITSFLHISKAWFVFVIGTFFLFSLPAMVNRSVLQGVLRFKEMIFSIVAESTLKLVFGAFLVYLGFEVGGALVGFGAALVIGWYLSEIYLKAPHKKNNVHPSNLKAMFFYAFPVMIQSFAVTSLYSSDVILVKHFFSSYEAGIYGAISTLGKIIFFGTGPIGAVMFPIVAKRQSKGEDYRRIFIYSFFATFCLASVVLMIYFLFPEFIITMLYNSSYIGAKNLLFWFGLFMSLFTFSSLMINYSLSLGKTRIVLFPLFAALAQILIIWIYHPSLFSVVVISTVVISLLLISMFVYLNLRSLWK